MTWTKASLHFGEENVSNNDKLLYFTDLQVIAGMMSREILQEKAIITF